MLSKRFVNVRLSANNIMAIIDILEDYETEFRFQKIDFDKFLAHFGWTRSEYFSMVSDLESCLTDDELLESYNYCHQWKNETNNNHSGKR